MIAKNKLHVDPSGYESYFKSDQRIDGRGYFASYNPRTCALSRVYRCRESFGYRFRRHMRFIAFICDNLDAKKIDECFRFIEDKLNLDVWSVIYTTDQPRCIILKISPHWDATIASREMFTLMLRYAAIYYQGKFFEGFKRYQLLNSASRPVNRYLEGFTKWVPAQGQRYRYDDFGDRYLVIETVKPREGMFCDSLYRMTPKQLEQALIKP